MALVVARAAKWRSGGETPQEPIDEIGRVGHIQTIDLLGVLDMLQNWE